MRRHRLSILLCASLVAAGGNVASAQPAASDRAIELGRAGVELYQAKKWGECVAKFEAADAIVHSPVFDLYRARCLRGEGRLLRARALFDAVSKETLAPDAPPPWITAKADAATDLAEIQKLVPSVIVSLAPGDAEPVTIDGGKVALGAEIELDPGLHKLTFVRAGTDTSLTFEVAQGQRGVRVGSSATTAPGSSPAPGDTVPPPPPPEAPASSSGSVVPGAVLTAVGGAALIVGGIFGGLALDKYGTVKDNCPKRVCGSRLDDMNELRDEGDVFADASTGLLVSGGVVAAVGIVLLIVRPGGDDAQAAESPFTFRF